MRLVILLAAPALFAQSSRPTATVENATSALTVDLAGGSLVDFHFKDGGVNPLTWEERGAPAAPRPRGHFLCLDRWGPPSDAERKNGMPFHGEASRVTWKVTAGAADRIEMEAALPMAGLAIRRTIRLAGAVALVSESVANTNRLGRVYNMVQHPTIGPPFLDESTVVDSNARKGFMQSSPMPNPEEPPVWWPQALQDGAAVNLRHLRDDPNPNVVSYTIDEDHGWVTAANPSLQLLIGYVWRASHYPWFNAWRHVENGKPAARGLEFGTTGLHQPFPVLLEKGRIFGRALFAHLDAGQTVERSYAMFLARTPPGFTGVARVFRSRRALTIVSRPRGQIVIEAGSLLDDLL